MIVAFGGSFDPIHQGHLQLAREILVRYPVTDFYFVPAKQNPLKTSEPGALAADRLEMLRLAVREFGDPRVKVLDWEIFQTVPSYSIVTVERLAKRGPTSFLMGNEVFQTLAHWHQPKLFVGTADIIVVSRMDSVTTDSLGLLRKLGIMDGVPDTALTHRVWHSSHRHWIDTMPLVALPYASTSIRNALNQNLKTPGLPPSVWAYIKEKRLYTVNEG